jgi:hypothetical protein|uniref:Uncharacterized protein n=1 Tax=viral metagenome TaxID=1070528 RepID=A0A6C0CYZ3_9ZZZZ
MNKFPGEIGVNHKDNFSEYYMRFILQNLRQAIYKHILQDDENNCFDLENFCRSQSIKLTSIIEFVKTQIVPELVKLGWKYKFAYGETALFIYSSENPPVSWYEEI